MTTPDPLAPARAYIPASETPKPEKLLGLAVSVVVVAGLYLGREVLIPIVLAVMLSFLLAPLVGLLRRLHIPKVPAVLAAVLAALGIILALGGLIGSQIATLAQDIPRYESTMEQKVNALRNFSNTTLHRLEARLGHEGTPTSTPSPTPDITSTPSTNGQKPVPVIVQQAEPTPIHVLQQVLGPILSPLETLGIVFVVAIFILLQREDLRDRLIRLFGSNDLLRTTAALNDAGSRLGRYFLSQLAVNTTFGIVIGIGLAFIGVPNPILWGVLSALLRFVPYVGSLIAAILPLALAAAVDPGWTLAAWTAGLYVIVEGLTGQVVEPLVYGHSTGLSPVAVIVVAIFWSWIWGPIGLILSTPLTLCLVVLGRHVDHLEFFDILLGDRPALTPTESFYQRLLAGDENEIRRQAETLLKQRALSSYYDNVVLPGLQMAAADIQRNALDPERIALINTRLKKLTGDLNQYNDTTPEQEPPQESVAGIEREGRTITSTPAPTSNAPDPDRRTGLWRNPKPILCIAGRGPLDEAASTALAQLLAKHNLGARLIPHTAVSQDELATLDEPGTAMICLSYLDLNADPHRLRHLLERLQEKLPQAEILVGLWPRNTEKPPLETHSGARHYVSTLHEAVETCLAAERTAAKTPSTHIEPTPTPV